MKELSFRKLISIGLAGILLAFSLAACSSAKPDNANKDNATENPTESTTTSNAKAGTYSASEQGYGGELTVQVEIANDGTIKEINAVCPNETETIGQKAAPKICEAVTKNQSLAVDTVSGATVTSTAVLTAIEKALTDAGADIDALKAK